MFSSVYASVFKKKNTLQFKIQMCIINRRLLFVDVIKTLLSYLNILGLVIEPIYIEQIEYYVEVV